MVRRSGEEVTVEVTVRLSGTLLEIEGAILEATIAVGRCATAEALKRFDTDGSPIRVGEIKLEKPGTETGSNRRNRGQTRVSTIIGPSVPARQQQIGMPRHARIVAIGFPMHVIRRGIDRTAIFFAAGDYRVFSDTLVALAERESVRVHACVLMTNHAHLLTPPTSARGPARLMKGLGQRFSSIY